MVSRLSPGASTIHVASLRTTPEGSNSPDNTGSSAGDSQCVHTRTTHDYPPAPAPALDRHHHSNRDASHHSATSSSECTGIGILVCLGTDKHRSHNLLLPGRCSQLCDVLKLDALRLRSQRYGSGCVLQPYAAAQREHAHGLREHARRGRERDHDAARTDQRLCAEPRRERRARWGRAGREGFRRRCGRCWRCGPPRTVNLTICPSNPFLSLSLA